MDKLEELIINNYVDEAELSILSLIANDKKVMKLGTQGFLKCLVTVEQMKLSMVTYVH
jgi:hypothetical protein